LEVGCGDGALATTLAAAGYDVTAIDPRAPLGEIFEQERLEDFTDERPFDAVVASLSLHHVADIGAAVEKIHGLLESGGLLLLDEFDSDLFTGATARWYHEQRLERGADIPADFDTFIARWHADHDDVHPFEELRTELSARFTELVFERITYLFDYHLDDALEPVERKLIDAGEISAIGVRHVSRARVGG